MLTKGDRIRTKPKVKPQTIPIQTENRKNRIWFGWIWVNRVVRLGSQFSFLKTEPN
jgi:hypothetical protein